MHETISTLALGALIALGGCAGDPAVDETDVALDTEVERAIWEGAEPGCEGVARTDLTLAACEGEPLLGALVDTRGNVACVDALGVLLVDTGAVHTLHATSADPAPQPSHPGMGDTGAVRLPVSGMAEEGEISPPSGGVLADPTPTPITQPMRRDPTPTPIVQPDERRDPTPTPVMRD